MTPSRFFFLIATGLAVVAGDVSATAPSALSYWVSMRGIAEDAQASFVAAAYAQGGAYTSGLTACGHTYYLTPADAAAVQAARTAGDTVQIHAGEPNSTAAQSDIVCLVQADQ